MFFHAYAHLVDNFLQASHRRDDIVVGTFGNND